MQRLLLVTLMLSASFMAKSQAKTFIDQPYIEVGGTADTLVTPDEIYIRILLSEKDSRDRVGIEALEQKMFDALKSLGLDIEKNLTVSDMSSNFKSYLFKSKDVIKTRLYILNVTDASTASRVFLKLEENDISNTSIERVEYSGLNNLKNIMRAKAILDAKTRAVVFTRSLNQTVAAAIHIIDADNAIQQSPSRGISIQIRGNSSLLGYSTPPTINFEKIRVIANVNVKFVIE